MRLNGIILLFSFCDVGIANWRSKLGAMMARERRCFLPRLFRSLKLSLPVKRPLLRFPIYTGPAELDEFLNG